MKLKDGFFLMPENVDSVKSTYPISIPTSHIQNTYFEMDEFDWIYLRETAKAFKSKKWKNYELEGFSIKQGNKSGMFPVFSWFNHQIIYLTKRMRTDKKIEVENLLMGYMLGYMKTFVRMLELKSILDSSPEIKSKVLTDWKQEQILHLAWETKSAEELLDCLLNPENLMKAPQHNRA